MKALLSHRPGPPESLVLEDVAEAAPGAGEISIRVIACGANFPDLLMVADRYQFRPPRPFAPGAEVAGIVEAVGSGVAGFAPGDRVMAICSWGGMAEKLVVSETKCVPVPDFMPMDEAAAFQLTYGTAHYALVSCGKLVAGQTLLVLGAAGGVGLAAVELGKALSASVVAAVSSPEKAEVARGCGADATIVYPRGPLDRDARRALAAEFRQATGGGPHLILDPVGGDYSEAALRAIRRRGRLVVVGFAGGIPSIPLNLVLLNDARIVAGAWGAVVAEDPARFRSTIADLVDLYARGLLRPRISERLPLKEGARALSLLEERSAIGKIVIEIGREAT